MIELSPTDSRYSKLLNNFHERYVIITDFFSSVDR